MRLAEYIWIDGTKPTPQLRNKTKVLYDLSDPPVWGFDGSSTNQAPGENSDCVLNPVFVCSDPIRGNPHILVLCEVLKTNMQPHRSNSRSSCASVAVQYEHLEPWFGLEQEYTFIKDGRPLGFPETGYPAPQGPYYCSVGGTRAFGRAIVEKHLQACLYAGLRVSGINAEVMPGQWEFQIGPLNSIQAADHLWVARWLLERIAEDYDVDVSYASKPVNGDWNGAGCHTNFSTNEMRESYDAIVEAIEGLEKNAAMHIIHYGHGISRRLTGKHETCSHEEFRWGVSDRGASVRIPWQCAPTRNNGGYLEDRRPNANCDPYTVVKLILSSACSGREKING